MTTITWGMKLEAAQKYASLLGINYDKALSHDQHKFLLHAEKILTAAWLCLITLFCLITLAFAQKAYALDFAPFGTLPRVGVTGNLCPPIDGLPVYPTLTSFVPFGEGAAILNDDAKNKTVAKLGIGACAIQFSPRNIIRDVFDISFGRDYWHFQKIMVPDRGQRWVKPVSLITDRNTDIFNHSGQFPSIRYAVTEGRFVLNDLSGIGVCGRTEDDSRNGRHHSPNEDVGTLNYLDGLGGSLSSFRGDLCRLQGEKGQETLASTDDYQARSENHQQKIEPPTRIIWWRRGMASFVLLCCSIYAVRNGLLNLLRSQYVRGWGWLCGALLLAELGGFTLWLGLGIM